MPTKDICKQHDLVVIIVGKGWLIQCRPKKWLIYSGWWVIRPILNALVAQLDRATDYESVGRTFESSQAHHKIKGLRVKPWPFFVYTYSRLSSV